MEADNLTTAQRLLDGGPVDDARGTCRRLRDALQGGAREVGWRDIAALVRQVLLEQQAVSGAVMHLRVPLRAGLPTVEQWLDAGCIRLGQDADSVTIAAREWFPACDDATQQSVAKELTDVYLRKLVRTGAVPADPFWTAAVGHRSYMSLGQRQAARTVALAPPGSTTLVCLPTGQGKTDVVFAPILAASDEPGVSVVVVPTVALAIDMERRYRQAVSTMRRPSSPSGCYAYLGGLNPELKSAMREAIRDGRQRVVFAAPESVVQGIGAALSVAASRGYLRYVVFDEAHLIEQWGTEFRPDFQTIATQRSDWIRMARKGREPATVAMSATLTDDQVDYLSHLLPGVDTALVWASALRPEPNYLIQRFDTLAERQDDVLKAVERLPKPLALYVTRRQDARDWVRLLNEVGMRRVGMITGMSTDTERRALIDGWRGGDGADSTRYDIVVGTSAFGLGIDMSDVRSVVHACVPETIDRFYQEVGRSGRDGVAALSYLAIAPGDEEIAQRLSRKRIIKSDKGWRRWRKMRAGSEISARRYRVDLDCVPFHLDEGHGQNRAWNVRILNLMARADLVRLTPAMPVDPSAGNDDDTHDANLIDVEVISGAAMAKASWSIQFDTVRDVIQKAERQAANALRTAIAGDRCVGTALSNHYRAAWAAGILSTEINCRGCPYCRTHRQPLESGLYRQGVPPNPAVHDWTPRPADPLHRARGDSSVLAISWRTKAERQDLVPELLARLARRGMNVIGGPGCTGEVATELQREASPHAVIVDSDFDLLQTYHGPVVWLMADDQHAAEDMLQRRRTGGVAYLVHADPSMNVDHQPARRSYGDIPSLSVMTALGAL